ncbi:SDR family oxidoreductase [Francisellaceae bacterium]|nr:SDR family oxidoreductase [Francisellaceae bacterium]
MKNILITGASRGIGAELAKHWCKGNNIFLHYNSSKNKAKQVKSFIEENGGKANLIQADLTSNSGCERLVNELTKLTDKIDILVNNAGIYQKVSKSLDDISWDHCQAMLSVNTISPIILTKLLYDFLIKSDNPSVIFISSLAALARVEGCLPYVISKDAIESATQVYAKLLAPKIRVNAIAPGVIKTGIHQQACPDNPIKSEADFLAKVINERSALKKLTTYNEFNQVADLLATNKAMTGVIIDLNSGSSYRR